MKFDPTPFQWLPSLALWGVAFFLCFSIAAAVAFLLASVVTDHGQRKLLRYLARTPLRRALAWLGGVVGLLGSGAGAWLAGGELGSLLGPYLGATAGRLVERSLAALLAALVGGIGGYFLIPTVMEALRFNGRRVWTLAMLTVRESVRKKALLVFVVFAILFMFAGWFLQGANDRGDLQVRVYVSFVLTALGWLILPVVLLLSCWGLPEDIRLRSLHTVVTKPVRRNEVYLGRVLGFSLVGTLVLALMGVAGNLWIRNQVRGDDTRYLVSRVPVYADEFGFFDESGLPTKAGINVGNIWEFRSYIAGGTQARANWVFDDVTPDVMVQVDETVTRKDGTEETTTVDKLQLESTFEAFRTYKGNMERTLLVQYHFVKDLRRQTAQGIAGMSVDSPGVAQLRKASSQVEEGRFDEAGGQLRSVADGLRTGRLRLSALEYATLADGFRRLVRVTEPLDGTVRREIEKLEAERGELDQDIDARNPDDDRRADLQDRRTKVANSIELLQDAAWPEQLHAIVTDTRSALQDEDQGAAADGLETLGELFQEHADALELVLVDVDVPYSPPFTINEYGQNVTQVGRKIRVPGTDREVDLFEDLVHGGRLRIEVACLDQGQYLGMARPDLFIRRPDKSFEAGYYKALAGIWLMMLLIIVLGVTASTFVKGPVATLLTFTLVVVGTGFHGFLEKLVSGELEGSGTIESSYRLVKHMNPMQDLESTTRFEEAFFSVMQGTDQTIKGGLWIVYNVIPNFNSFRLAPWIANGFDVPWNAGLAPGVAMTLAYLLPCLVLGYYSLKLRELEAK